MKAPIGYRMLRGNRMIPEKEPYSVHNHIIIGIPYTIEIPANGEVVVPFDIEFSIPEGACALVGRYYSGNSDVIAKPQVYVENETKPVVLLCKNRLSTSRVITKGEAIAMLIVSHGYPDYDTFLYEYK